MTKCIINLIYEVDKHGFKAEVYQVQVENMETKYRDDCQSLDVRSQKSKFRGVIALFGILISRFRYRNRNFD